MVTVRDTGVASLAPQNTDQRDRRRPPGSPCRFANFRQVIQLAPNCPVMQYLIYQWPIAHASFSTPTLTNTQSLSVFSRPVDLNRQSRSLLHQRPVTGCGFDSHRLWQVIRTSRSDPGPLPPPFCLFLLLLLFWSHKLLRLSVLTSI